MVEAALAPQLPEAGMEGALAIARSLYQAADNAVRTKGLPSEDVAALNHIKNQIYELESSVRRVKVAPTQAEKDKLVLGIDPLRRGVIRACQQHQPAVRDQAAQDLIQMTLDWCELKHEAPAPTTPAHRFAAADSTNAVIDCSPLSTATDVSSGRSQAGSLGSFARASVGSLPTWRSQQQPLLRKVKTSAAAATGNSFPGPGGLRACAGRGSSGLGVQQQQDQDQDLGGDADAFGDVQALPACEPRWPFDQAAAGGLAAAQREHLLQLSGQRSRDSGCLDGSATTDGSSGVSGVVTPDQQAREARAAQAQRLAAQLRQARPFLHLDRGDAALGASSAAAPAAAPLDAGALCAAIRYRPSRDDDAEPAAQQHQPLWQGPAVLRTSLRASQDVMAALRRSGVVQAAILSSNASRVHVVHDAVARRPADGAVDVPLVPACLAVRPRRAWWQQLLRVVGGMLLLSGAAAAAVAAGSGEAVQQPRRQRASGGRPGAGKGGKQQSVAAAPTLRLPFAPVGSAPHASAGAG